MAECYCCVASNKERTKESGGQEDWKDASVKDWHNTQDATKTMELFWGKGEIEPAWEGKGFCQHVLFRVPDGREGKQSLHPGRERLSQAKFRMRRPYEGHCGQDRGEGEERGERPFRSKAGRWLWKPGRCTRLSNCYYYHQSQIPSGKARSHGELVAKGEQGWLS